MYILFKMFVLCYFVILTCIFFDKINVLYLLIIVGGLEALSEGGEGVPRGLKGEKSHLKAVYAQIIPT